MKRITPEEVLEAYKKTGLKPMQDDYYPVEGCACGMGVISAKLGMTGNLYTQLTEIYGHAYHDAFTNGFDGRSSRYYTEEERQAHQDGKAVWEAVKHLAAVSP